jgi:LPXTG-motif cell wall-anchored protein
MNWRKGVALLLFGALVLFGLLPSARADEWNKRTVVTLNEPVEVPGAVLQPGTYVFKLMDSPANRHIVQIYNQDETHLYTTILAIPDYRLKPADKTVMGFEERPSSSPEALKAWFYPGDQYGQEFVYPKSRGLEIAKATNQNVLTMPEPTSSPNASSVQAMENAPVNEVSPSGEEQQSGAATAPQTPTSSESQATENKPEQLPKTASNMPLFGLVGLIALGAGLALRFASKRIA